jgi:hypothetical protein
MTEKNESMSKQTQSKRHVEKVELSARRSTGTKNCRRAGAQRRKSNKQSRMNALIQKRAQRQRNVM